MRRTQLLFVIAMSFWSAVCAGSQATPSVPLPEELRAQLENERFSLVTSIRGLPLGVRSELQTLFGAQTLDIAEIGAEFQANEVVEHARLPTRRMVAAGCSYEYCLVYYERGGTPRTWRVALFHWSPELTRFEWGGAAPGGLATIDDVKKAVMSGAIKSPSEVW